MLPGSEKRTNSFLEADAVGFAQAKSPACLWSARHLGDFDLPVERTLLDHSSEPFPRFAFTVVEAGHFHGAYFTGTVHDSAGDLGLVRLQLGFREKTCLVIVTSDRREIRVFLDGLVRMPRPDRRAGPGDTPSVPVGILSGIRFETEASELAWLNGTSGLAFGTLHPGASRIGRLVCQTYLAHPPAPRKPAGPDAGAFFAA